MPRKAKNAPPWTKKKLHRYRLRKRAERQEEREREDAILAAVAESGVPYDKAMRGCSDG